MAPFGKVTRDCANVGRQGAAREEPVFRYTVKLSGRTHHHGLLSRVDGAPGNLKIMLSSPLSLLARTQQPRHLRPADDPNST